MVVPVDRQANIYNDKVPIENSTHKKKTPTKTKKQATLKLQKLQYFIL